MNLRLRRAAAADFRAYAGRDPDPDYAEDWFGYVVEGAGGPVGIGVLSLDRYGRFWAWTDAKEPLPAALVHRAALRMLAALREAGAREVHCYRDDALPTSEGWLKRLGFRPAPEILTPRDKPVWVCDLTR